MPNVRGIPWLRVLKKMDSGSLGSAVKRTKKDPEGTDSDAAPREFGSDPGCCVLERRVDRNLEPGPTTYGISPTSDDHIRLAVMPKDRQNAIDFPALGWPTFERL